MQFPVVLQQLGDLGPYMEFRPQFRDRKGGDPAEWPAALQVREWPAPHEHIEVVHGK